MTRPGVVSLLLWCLIASAPAGQTQSPAPPSTGLIAGRVVDASGAPVAYATVLMSQGTAAPSLSRDEATESTEPVLADGMGRFVFANVAPGSYRVEAIKPGWLTGALGRRRPGGNSTSIELAAAQYRNDLTITMWRAAVIAGRVTDDNGDPLIGVEVRAIRQVFIAGRRQADTPIRQKTDDRGEYRFSGLMPGDYLVAVLASVLSEPLGFAGAIRVGGERPRAYLQTMTAVGTSPIVFDRATGVASGGRALVGSLWNLPSVPSADAGWPVYPTTFHPSTMAMRSAALVRAVSGEARADVDVTVRLTPTWQVSGVLRDPDGPAAWNAVHLIPADAGDTPLVDVSTAVTDAAGAFTFYGVPPGQYIARVVRTPWPADPNARLGLAGGTGQIPYVTMMLEGPPSDVASVPTEPLLHVSELVTVADRHVRNLALTLREGSRVRGRARFEGAAPQPTADAWRTVTVLALPANGRMDRAMTPGRFSSDGQFTTPSLWPGRYLIRASAPLGWTFKDATYQGRDVSETALDITGDIDQVVITFTDKPRTIKGTVQGDTGASVEGSAVLLFPVDRAGWIDYGRTSRKVASATVGATGEFSIAAPPDGDYYVVAIPDEQTGDWQNPTTLAKLTALAERIQIRGDGPVTQSLRLRRIQ